MEKICPFLSMATDPLEDWSMCREDACALWDKGVFDKYEEGCGLVPRENRRL